MKFLIVCLLVNIQLYTQNYIYKNLSVEDGLIESQVRCIHKDKQGYLWFATHAGISRWNGANFKNFAKEDGLSGTYVSSIYESNDGSLYFATNTGLSVFKNSKIYSYSYSYGLKNNHLNTVFEDKNSKLLVGAHRGVYNFTNDTFKLVFPELKNYCITGITDFVDDTYIIATKVNGFFHVRKDGRIVGSYQKNFHVRSLKRISKNEILVISQKGFYLFKKNNIELIRVWENKKSYLRSFIQMTSDNEIFVLTGKKIYKYKNKKLSLFIDDLKIKNPIFTFYMETTSQIFIGTNGAGIKIIQESPVKSLNEEDGISNLNIMSIVEDYDGNFFISTLGGGVFKYRNDKIHSYNTNNGLVSNYIISSFLMNDSSIYFGTDGDGIVSLKKNSFEKIYFKKTHEVNRVISLCQDLNDTVYIGTYNSGLWNFPKDQPEKIKFVKEISKNIIYSIKRDKNGIMYFATTDGLFIKKNSKYEWLDNANYDKEPVRVVYPAPDSSIYFSTYSGLIRYYRGKYRKIDTGKGLSNNIVYGISESLNGKIYVTGTRGLNIISKSNNELKIRILSHKNGLTSNEANLDAIHVDSRNKLWVGTIKGVSIYSPYLDSHDSDKPIVHIEEIKLYGKKITQNKKKFFPHFKNQFSFNFIGINFTNPDDVSYRYRLIGYEKKWQYTKERNIQYTNLKPGNYSFELTAKNSGSEWAETKRYVFKISGPYWKSWWFISVLISVFLLSIYYFHRQKVKQAIAIEQVRTQIACDLHDETGASLVRISAYSQSLIHLIKENNELKTIAENIYRNCNKVTRDFRDSIWSIDARNETIGHLIARIQDTAKELFFNSDIKVVYNINAQNKGKVIVPKYKQNIYLLCKEALTNIRKHSNAGMIFIDFIQKKTQCIIVIKDNGYVKKESVNKGNGLNNMFLRAKQINALLKISTINGFVIDLTVNLESNI